MKPIGTKITKEFDFRSSCRYRQKLRDKRDAEEQMVADDWEYWSGVDDPPWYYDDDDGPTLSPSRYMAGY